MFEHPIDVASQRARYGSRLPKIDSVATLLDTLDSGSGHPGTGGELGVGETLLHP